MTKLDAEPAESVAEAVAALTRALTGAVTETDLEILGSAIYQVQVRLDAQEGVVSRVTYDLTDDHPGQTSGRGGRGGAVRTVRADLPGALGMSLAALSESTGKDMAFLMSAGTTLLCLMVAQLRAGRSVYAEDPASGRRSEMTLDWA